MTSPVAPRRRTLSAVLAAGFLAAAALLVPASPASAHDELVSTDPSADAVLTALPPQITLSYSADILTDPGATVIEVTDSSGASLADGAPQVSGAAVTQALAGAASGTVTVKWRVVSSDGHPIDGDFAFAVPAASESPRATTAPAASESPSVAESTAPTATPDATPLPAETSSEASPLPWILLAVALVIVAGVLVYVFASRAGRKTAGGGGTGR